MKRRRSPFEVHRTVKRTTWQTRLAIRALALVAMPVAFLAWTAIGLVSMQQLGSVLRQVGTALEEYDF